MFYDEMQVTVDTAAAMLPDPPPPGNLEGCVRWEALTLDTGRLLARVLKADIGLLKTLIDDDCLTPVECRQRRRLLLRVALLWACQMTQGKPRGLGLPHHHWSGSADNTTISPTPLPSLTSLVWLDARSAG
jgi:hypothetical protein